ncbi:NUC091 domain-containing protein [Melampsora americana]|nr:NUC091 domain-containing protein [Melampsora americana]
MPPKTKSSASRKLRAISKPGPIKQHVKGENFYRDASKAKRVKMLSNDGGKAIRDRDGTILKAAAFQSSDAPPGRIQPDRRWFGNTRVISQKALDHFRTSLAEKQADPYSVILKQNKLPMSLLQSDADRAAEGGKGMKVDLVIAEPFDQTFGPKQRRKRPRLSGAGTFEEFLKEAEDLNANKKSKSLGGEKLPPVDGLGEFIVGAEKQLEEIDDGNDELHNVAVDYILSAGTSKRIWSELYKVIDSSDVILHVLDARDPLGTRCLSVENYLAKEKRGKKMVYILNKVDLVPGWVAARWVKYLSKSHPVVAFHASINNSFGKGSLIQLLRQFSSLFSDRKQISVGFIGYPNVGKSSIINTLKKKKVCNVAPIPGETKIWQYITLMRRIYLIDCPGIVPPSSKDSEASKVLKGVVRIEHLSSPADHIPALLERIRPEYMKRTYGVEDWIDSEDFLTKLARKSGKLLKGGEPDLRNVATSVLNDWIRGKIPFYVPPPTQIPGLKPSMKSIDQVNTNEEGEKVEEVIEVKKKTHVDETGEKVGFVKGVAQPLHQIVRSNKFLDVDEVGEFEHADLEMEQEGERVENDLNNSDLEVDEDEDDDIDAWSGIGSEDEDEESDSELCFEDLVANAAGASNTKAKSSEKSTDLPAEATVDCEMADGCEEVDADSQSDFDEDDDLDLILESDTTKQKPKPGQKASANAKGKRKANHPEYDSEEEMTKQTKDPRMKTNKKKAENFFTHANVKNKNRSRQIPKGNEVGGSSRKNSRGKGGKKGKSR